MRGKQRSSRIFDGVGADGSAVTIMVRRDRPSLVPDARRLIGVEHPGLVTVRDAEEADDGWVVVTDAWSGPTLASLLTRTPVPPEDVVALLAPIASALDRLASARAVHEGLCAESIVVMRGRLALIGVPSGPAIAPSDREDSTIALRMPETLDYVPPELLAKPPRPDIYALGVLAFRLMAGEMPYPKYKSLTRTLVERRETPPQRVAAAARRPIAKAIETWADEALARDRERRPRTAVALIDALARAVDAAADHEEAVSRLLELELGDGSDKATRLDSPVVRAEGSGSRLRATPSDARMPSIEIPIIDAGERASSIPPPIAVAIEAQPPRRWLGVIAIGLATLASAFIALALGHLLLS